MHQRAYTFELAFISTTINGNKAKTNKIKVFFFPAD